MKSRILELRAQGKTYKEIAEALGCAMGTISYHCKPFNVEQKTPANVISLMQPLYDRLRSCREVAEALGVVHSTVLKHIVTKEKLTTEEKKAHRVVDVVSWRQRRKVELVEYKGGCCMLCGYKKCTRALTFHHLDPTKKDFTISGKSWSAEKLKAEADKCILLCANCHIEEHDRLDNEKKK